MRKKTKKTYFGDEKIKFINCDMFSSIDEKFDVIIANPPYIKSSDIKNYDLEYEPSSALDGGEDGLKFYKTIVDEGYKYLNKKGTIILEIGYNQKEDVINLAKKNKNYREVYCIKDLALLDRVVVIGGK